MARGSNRVEDFFKPYQDTYFAHIWEFLLVLGAMYIVLWVQTSVASGTSDYDIVSFTFNLGILALILKGLALMIYFIAPGKEDKTFISTLSFGSGLNMIWGITFGLAIVAFLNLGLIGGKLSFFSPFLQFGNTHMFWFLVVLGPIIEESFSNVLHPMMTYLLKAYGERNGMRLNYLLAGSLALFLIVAPAFSVFHYVTYWKKSGETMSVFLALLLAAYIYRVVFTLGNYVLRSDAFGMAGHMLHNLIGYWVMIDNPFKILPWEQQAMLVAFFFLLGMYFLSVLVYRVSANKSLLPGSG